MEITIPAGLKEKLLTKVDEYQKTKGDIDVQWLIQQGTELMANLEPALFYRMNYFAKELKMPVWLVISNLLIDNWARQAASVELGGPNDMVLPCFIRDDESTRTGEALFDFLKAYYKQEITLEKESRKRQLQEQIRQHPELQTILQGVYESMGGGDLKPNVDVDEKGNIISIEAADRLQRAALIEKLPPKLQDLARRNSEKIEAMHAEALREVEKQKPEKTS
jgi:hypothetical protein